MVYFWRLRVISTKYGHESTYFFMKNRKKKKGIVLTFLVHNPYKVVLTELSFFWTKYEHGTRGSFIK